MNTFNINTENGWTEISINDKCDYSEFYKVAEYLEAKLNIEFINNVDDFDSLYWSFFFNGQELMLHYNIYIGVSLFPAKFKECSQEDNKAVLELGQRIIDVLFPKLIFKVSLKSPAPNKALPQLGRTVIFSA